MYKRQDLIGPLVEEAMDKFPQAGNKTIAEFLIRKYPELFTLESVSYTHLDVYKRQKLEGEGNPVETTWAKGKVECYSNKESGVDLSLIHI